MTEEETRQAMIAKMTAGLQCLDLDELAELAQLTITFLNSKEVALRWDLPSERTLQ